MSGLKRRGCSSGSDKGACQALILAAGTYQHHEYGHVGAARLIQKIYKVDPLVCPKCFG
jgi:hypothetical protein